VSNASENEIIDLIKKRSNIYSKALYKIECDSLTKKKIVEKILNIYEAH
jgi:shikimate kinase/shikimate kinase/3-dehydroquinate synthase